MKTLTVCLATFNEEANLHHALDSVIDWVDEVIVVDGGSEDGTIKLLKEYGKKVHIISTDNPPMFHINKQKAISQAKGDWILQLDADEAVSPELRAEIQQILSTEEATDGYWVPRKNWFLGRFLTKGGQYPDYTIRLYKNGVAHFPCKTVHENVTVEGSVGYLKSDLLHYADPTFSRYVARWNRYTSLDAHDLHVAGARPGVVSYWFAKPISTFFMMYIRHRGYVDGFSGFVFALFSALRFWVIYIKYCELGSA